MLYFNTENDATFAVNIANNYRIAKNRSQVFYKP